MPYIPARTAPTICTALTLCVFAALQPLAFAQAPSAAPSHASATPIANSGRSPQSGTVTAIEAPIAGTTDSVTTINPSVSISGPFSGSAPGGNPPFAGSLSLRDAIQRGLNYNLGALGQNNSVLQAVGQSQIARSALLPNVSGYLAETIQQVNLAAEGVRIHVPIAGFNFPTVIGPINNIDLRGSVSQSIFDATAWNNYRSSRESLRAAQLNARDARDAVVLAVCGTYLQVLATEQRVAVAHAQLTTATVLFNQTQQKRLAGLVAQIDLDRSDVERMTQQQRVTSLETSLAKQKISLARLVGLPPNNNYTLSDSVPFAAAPSLSLDDAIHQALQRRADLQAAQAQVRAAERTLAAARDERIPSLSVSGNYGALGTNPAQAKATYSAAATLSIPLWNGGRTEGEIHQAEAAVRQRQAELDDQRAQVEADVRNAWLDLQASASQITVAERNLQVSKETLDLTRQRFDAGVADNVEVVQAQETVTSAELDRINSLFAHNLAKLSLARAVEGAATTLQQFLDLK
ncbi:MAG TPA: TolC family protein [Acidobacteriaceae bacterium]|nr:TolC family protein [Acidobacteriaceae bacterium]